jgi:hypothetical protein
MSKAQKILSENIGRLIGEGKMFRNDADMGERTGLGQRQIHRLRHEATDPRLSNLDALSLKLRCPLPALLSPEFDVLQGALQPRVADIVRRIVDLANKNALEENDLLHLSTSIQLIENSKASVMFTSESQKRGTGT